MEWELTFIRTLVEHQIDRGPARTPASPPGVAQPA
jgi:hypothetical protein